MLLNDQEHVKGTINLPIDIFLRSLAEDQGDKAVAVILSGSGSDGMRGVRAIKEFAGIATDVDTPDDIERLLRRDPNARSRAVKYLHSIGITGRQPEADREADRGAGMNIDGLNIDGLINLETTR